MIEQAATDHVAASLYRAGVTERAPGARRDLREDAPLSITVEVPQIEEQPDAATAEEQRRAGEEAEAAHALALHRQGILRDMANELRDQLKFRGFQGAARQSQLRFGWPFHEETAFCGLTPKPVLGFHHLCFCADSSSVLVSASGSGSAGHGDEMDVWLYLPVGPGPTQLW